MSPVKEKMLQVIESLPDNASLDDIFAELYFRMQVDKGLKELDEGKEISHAAAKSLNFTTCPATYIFTM